LHSSTQVALRIFPLAVRNFPNYDFLDPHAKADTDLPYATCSSLHASMDVANSSALALHSHTKLQYRKHKRPASHMEGNVTDQTA